MTKVDFYLLQDLQSMVRYRTACRITEKAYTLGHRVHIHTDSPDISQQIDNLLWSFRDRSFVPHEIEPEKPEHCPVSIGHGWLPQQREVLVNLAAEVPEFLNGFTRVVEIIDQQEETRDSGRKRYRFYRDAGFPLTHHKVTP